MFHKLAADLSAKHNDSLKRQHDSLQDALAKLLADPARLARLDDHQRDLLTVLLRRLHIDPFRHIELENVEMAAVRLVDYCRKWQTATGGLHKLSSIRSYFDDTPTPVIDAAISVLHNRGYSGFKVVRFCGEPFLQCAPVELVNDDWSVLGTAEGGCVIAVGGLGWTEERVARAMGGLLEMGLIWWDAVDGEFWIVAKFI